MAEHLLRTTYIAYALCYLAPEADRAKVVYMSMFHDFAEGRTSDLNYVHQRYGRLAEAQAFKDIAIPSFIIFSIGTASWLCYGLYLHDVTIILSFGLGVVGSWTILGLSIWYRERK